MRLVVPIKQVPFSENVKMDPETGTMVREGVESIINPLDLYAIELALVLREQCDGEVIAISMGPAQAAKALKEAIAMGCDSAVLLSDKAFAGSDTWATSYVLQAAVRKLGDVAVVICGERATDGETGQVGPGIAAFLDWPAVTYISRVESARDGCMELHRMVEGGWQKLRVQLPAVLTVVKEVSTPRLPTLRGKQKAKAADLPVWGAGDLDVQSNNLGLAGSPTRVVKIDRPKVARECRKLIASDEATTTAAAKAVVEYLRKKQVI
ncbi:MAG: electron transfer flavoprotein subunit beta/FixA family protein [Planctomycetota bacterium]|jgi:electron transfer flavoprotein beta subunit